jgi:hypothetical protein
MNLLELLNQASQWNQGASIFEQVRKALQNDWGNEIHALVTARGALI